MRKRTLNPASGIATLKTTIPGIAAALVLATGMVIGQSAHAETTQLAHGHGAGHSAQKDQTNNSGNQKCSCGNKKDHKEHKKPKDHSCGNHCGGQHKNAEDKD